MWPPPEPGDIVWCRFPDRARDVPGAKPRPALVFSVDEYEDGRHVVRVAYGTSQRVNQLVGGEFAIRQQEGRAAYALAGLSYDTKFDLGTMVDLPWSDEFFAVPPRPEHGQTPKLGCLHPSLVKSVQSAARAAGIKLK